MSVVTVETPDTYEDDGFPIDKGLMDPRLGVIDPSLVCRTCGFRGGDCQGAVSEVETVKDISVVLNLQGQLFTLVLVMLFTRYYVPPVMNVAVFF